MYVLSLILFLFSFSSFSQTDYIQNWKGAIDIQVRDEFPVNKLITEPAGTTQHIFTISYLNSNFQKRINCLVYSIPKKQQTGHLKIIAPKLGQSCEEVIFDKGIKEWKEVYNFAFNVEKSILILKIDTQEIKIPMMNLNQQDSSLLVSFSNSSKPGISLKENDICFDVNDDCEESVKYQCQLCPNGIQNIIASSCPTKLRKICSKERCGQSGGYACMRGYAATGYTGDYCINDSPIAFCEGDSRVICVDGILKCR